MKVTPIDPRTEEWCVICKREPRDHSQEEYAQCMRACGLVSRPVSGNAEPERGSREYRRIHGPACGCPRCRGDEDEPVQTTNLDDYDRVRTVLERHGALHALGHQTRESLARAMTEARADERRVALSETESHACSCDPLSSRACDCRTEGGRQEREAIVEWLRSDEHERIGCSAGGIARLDKLADEIDEGRHRTVPEKPVEQEKKT